MKVVSLEKQIKLIQNRFNATASKYEQQCEQLEKEYKHAHMEKQNNECKIKALDRSLEKENMIIKYNATLKDYKNIQCTKVTFVNIRGFSNTELFQKIKKNINDAIKLFLVKTLNIKDYHIVERILTKLVDNNDKEFTRTVTRTDFYEMMHGYMKFVLYEYEYDKSITRKLVKVLDKKNTPHNFINKYQKLSISFPSRGRKMVFSLI